MYEIGTSTNHMKKHLQSKHHIDIDGKSKALSAYNITQYIADPNDAALMPLVGLDLGEKLKHYFVRWTVSAHIAVNVVENQYFRQLLKVFSSNMLKLLPLSHNTIKEWVMEAYKQKKREVRNMISHSQSNVHLSFNLWTSENSLALLAVCGHFVDMDYNIQTMMLTLC